MAWKTILEKEQIGIRIDDKCKDVILEVNSGGVMNNYITLHLSGSETEELIDALKVAKAKVCGIVHQVD